MPGLPDTLMAWHRDDLLLSADGGCSWRSVANIPGADFPPTLTPASDGRVYAWSENRSFLVRYDARGAVKLKQPVDFMGVGVDAANGDHVRAGGNDGTVWESTDAGETWTKIGALEGAILVYRFTFDPKNLEGSGASGSETPDHFRRSAAALYFPVTPRDSPAEVVSREIE